MRGFAMLAAAVAVVAIAACSRGPDHLQPGLWELRTKLTDFDAPGAPPAAQAQARAQLNQEQSMRTCVTAEQASNPLQDMRLAMAQLPATANCTTSENRFSGGTIRMRLSCRPNAGQQGEVTVATDGDFTEITLQATSVMNVQASDASGTQRAVRFNTAMRGIRVGDCPGGAAKPGNTL